MIKSIKNYFERKISPEQAVTSQDATERSLMLATAALLIEISRADREIKDEELDAIDFAVQKAFGVSKEETEELVRLAEEEVREAVSFHQFTHLINKGFSYEKKKEVVELLWRVVYADREMEKHEEYLLRRIATLLHVAHEDFIEAKLRAREFMEKGG